VVKYRTCIRTLTSIEVCERCLVFAITFFEQDIERILAAALLQILEPEFRRVFLILDCNTHEALRQSIISEA